MFPEANDPPTKKAELAGDASVARLVQIELLAPELSAFDGMTGMLWTTVPEATIDEDGKFVLWEYEIRPARQSDVATPAGDPVEAKGFYQRQLGALVPATADRRHECRSFRFG